MYEIIIEPIGMKLDVATDAPTTAGFRYGG
jgi:hypothetical protein